MRDLIKTAAAVGAVLLALWSDAAWAEKRVALVIGNSAYQNAPKLSNPARDSNSIAEMFRSAKFDLVIAAQDVENREFKRKIQEFEAQAYEADIAVIYYAGHGVAVNGTSYLVPVDAKLTTDKYVVDEGVSIDRVLDSVESVKKLRLIILDACRDNPFLVNMKRRQATRQLQAGVGINVRSIDANTAIAYAAKDGQTADDGDGEHSPFTTALLHNLTKPGLDIRLAFGLIRDEVLKTTNNQQEPYVYGSLGGGVISLVPASELSPVDPDDARRSYELVEKVGTRKAWELFLKQYPSGFFHNLGQEQLDKLMRLEPPAAPRLLEASPEEKRAWEKIKDSNSRDALLNFLGLYPTSPLAVTAQARLEAIERTAKEAKDAERAAKEEAERARVAREAAQQWRKIKSTNIPDVLRNFIDRYPGVPEALYAQNRLDALDRAVEEARAKEEADRAAKAAKEAQAREQAAREARAREERAKAEKEAQAKEEADRAAKAAKEAQAREQAAREARAREERAKAEKEAQAKEEADRAAKAAKEAQVKDEAERTARSATQEVRAKEQAERAANKEGDEARAREAELAAKAAKEAQAKEQAQRAAREARAREERAAKAAKEAQAREQAEQAAREARAERAARAAKEDSERAARSKSAAKGKGNIRSASHEGTKKDRSASHSFAQPRMSHFASTPSVGGGGGGGGGHASAIGVGF
jgi:DNA segregation ATPase FtsK/SpoIIIE-like protein